MLALKKMKKEKLIVYALIISAMISGTSFFIYQNKKLTSSGKAPSVIIPVKVIEKVGDQVSAPADNLITGEAGEGDIGDLNNADNAANKAAMEDERDFEIFNNPKYKSLKDITTALPEYRAGKKNPFEPFN